MSRRAPKSSTDIPKPARSIVLVGLMGAGKSCIGKRLAQCLDMPFVDADDEIEAAADCSIEEIFDRYGEQAFRDGERRVIARLLDGRPRVVATGGGAFVNAETRARIRAGAISVWLKADLDVLLARVSRRNNRPLLRQGDRRETLTRLMTERDPHYAEADIVVETGNEPPETTVERVIEAIAEFGRRTRADTAAE